jgi:hypothetical protein
VPGRPQQPDEPRRDHAAGVVVADDGVGLSDPHLGHPAREHLRLRERVAARLRRVRRRQPLLELDVDRAGDVPGVVRRAARPPVGVPADVGEHEFAAMLLHPDDVDDRVDHPSDRIQSLMGVRCVTLVARSPPRGG